MSDITILSCPICNYPKLREYGNGIYQCDFCETYFDKDENIVLTEQEYLQTCDTKQLAEFLACVEARQNADYNAETKAWVEWLKQQHKDTK